MQKQQRKKQYKWYPLDNAAKIYPPTVTEDRAHVFAFSAILTEEVDPFLLREAVSKLLEHYPTFKTRLMAGKFWYYLEQNDKPVKVFKEKPLYLTHVNYEENNGYLFEVLYIRNKITVKFFHALTDGTGGFNFFKSLLTEYFAILGRPVDAEGLSKPLDAPASAMEEEDSFLTFHNSSKVKTQKIEKPFHIVGTPFLYDGCGLITAKIDVASLKSLAKSFNATVTAYLASLYMQSIYKVYLKDRPAKNKIVSVLIPCNLRKKYGGETTRNFTMFARFTVDFSLIEPDFDQLIKICTEQMQRDLSVENLDKVIDDNVRTEKNFLIKIVPLGIKNLIMRAVYSNVGEVLQTVAFSNIGSTTLPESVEPYVKDLTFAITPTFSCGHQTGVIGYKGNLYVTFSRNFVETDLEKTFIRALTANGVPVEVSSNYWESQL